MKSSGERKFHKFNAKFKPAFCQYTVVCSAIFHFSAVFSDIFKQICQNFRIKMLKLFHFHFQKNIFGCFSNNFIWFFSMTNNNFYSLKIFNCKFFKRLFFRFCFEKNIFQNNFCQISAPNFFSFLKN